MATNGLTQGVSVALGLQSKFDWRSVAVSAVAAPLSQYTGAKVAGWFGGEAALQAGGYNWTKFARDATSNLTTAGVRSAFGGRFDVNQVVADVFGNALANSIVDNVSTREQAISGRVATMNARARELKEVYGLGSGTIDQVEARRLARLEYRLSNDPARMTADVQDRLADRAMALYGASDADRAEFRRQLQAARTESAAATPPAATSLVATSGADQIEEIVVTARRRGDVSQSAFGRFISNWQDPLATVGRTGERIGAFVAENAWARYGLTALEAISAPALFAGRKLFEATELGRRSNEWLGEKSQQIMEEGTSFINSDGRIGNLQKSAQIAGGLMLGVGLAAGGVKLFTKLAGSVGAFFRSSAPNRVEGTVSSVAPRQTMATGGEWYEYYAGKYGAQNVDWVSGSGRTIAWPSELPMPATTSMIRVPPLTRSGTFVRELESVAGPRPPGTIAHHTQPLGLGGVDNGALNGSWVYSGPHTVGHGVLNPQVNVVPYGTQIRIKPQ